MTAAAEAYAAQDNDARVLPHSADAEDAVVSAALASPHLLDAIRLDPDCFDTLFHRVAWLAIQKLKTAGVPICAASVAQCFPAADRKETETHLAAMEASGIGYNADMIAGRAAALRHLALRRRLIVIGESIANDATDAEIDEPARDMVTRARRAIDELERNEPDQKRAEAGARAEAILRRDAAALKQSSILSRIDDLDDKLGGFQRRRMYVVAGRPGMGKSSVVADLALTVALDGLGVLLISTEMDADEVAARIMSSRIRRTYDWKLPYTVMLRRGADLDKRDMAWAERAASDLDQLPIEIDDGGGKSVADIAVDIRSARRTLKARGFDLGMVIVDHIQHVRPTADYRGNKVAETTEVSNGLLALCKAENIALVACSQLNRAVESSHRADRRPTMADIRESGSVEQDAHAIILLFRPEYYAQKGEPDKLYQPTKWEEWNGKLQACADQLEMIVDKNRSGPTGTVRAKIHVETSTVLNND